MFSSSRTRICSSARSSVNVHPLSAIAAGPLAAGPLAAGPLRLGHCGWATAAGPRASHVPRIRRAAFPAEGQPSGSQTDVRTNVGIEPGAERPGGDQEACDVGPRRRSPQPRLDGPFPPGDQPLRSEQPDPRVIRGVSPGRGLQRIAGMDADPVFLHGTYDLLQLPAGGVAGYRLAVALQLAGGHGVHPVTCGQAPGVELDIPAADTRANIGLVRRLVLAEPDVPVGAEDLRAA